MDQVVCKTAPPISGMLITLIGFSQECFDCKIDKLVLAIFLLYEAMRSHHIILLSFILHKSQYQMSTTFLNKHTKKSSHAVKKFEIYPKNRKEPRDKVPK